MANWIIRPAKELDIPFIYSTWIESYRYFSTLGKSCRNFIFFPNYNRVIDWILNQEDTTVDVACDPTNDVVMYGYVVKQPNIIHYVYVKQAFWGFGIAKDLVKETDNYMYTHRTMSIEKILDKHPELIYNPFLLFKQGAQNAKTNENTTGKESKSS